MKLYLAGTYGLGLPSWLLPLFSGGDADITDRVNILESFYYVAPWQVERIHKFKSFMLDSGAFTFRKNASKSVDWDEYLTRYIEFINKNDVSMFFELDIDAVVGYEQVLMFRDRLEKETGKKSIPVWHKSRGWDDWLDTCAEYEYVAIGGIASESKGIDDYLPLFVRQAHKLGAKVHGLGYTRLDKLARIGFDSVDSTAWLYGNRSGTVYAWDGLKMAKQKVPSGKKMRTRDVARHNFIEWARMATDIEAIG